MLSQQRLTTQWVDFAGTFLRQSSESLDWFLPAGNKCWTGSAGEGIFQVLKHLKMCRVGVPAFTCQVVVDAVLAAGCEPVFYDTSIVTKKEDVDAILSQIEVLLVVHTFGMVAEIGPITQAAHKLGVVVIEDCAQALGARYKDGLVGSFGDFAVFSFGLSKNISAAGGLIISQKKIIVQNVQAYPLKTQWLTLAKLFTHRILLHPWIYPMIQRQLKSENQHYVSRQPYQLPPYFQRLVLTQAQRYDQVLARRQSNGEIFTQLSVAVKPLPQTAAAWLYTTILVENRKKVQRALQNFGVEFGVMETFKCFDPTKSKASESEKKHLTFALYRAPAEIQISLKILEKVMNEK